MVNPVKLYMTELYYTGVGSRCTPTRFLILMTILATTLERLGYILRSGGATGADSAFSDGVLLNSNKHIFLTKADFFDLSYYQYTENQIQNARFFIFNNNIHPLWHKLSSHDKSLHTRNVFQVLGVDMDLKSKFTICWTHDAVINFDDCTRRTGGTATAIKISYLNNIPVFNLANINHLQRILKFLKKHIDENTFQELTNHFPEVCI